MNYFARTNRPSRAPLRVDGRRHIIGRIVGPVERITAVSTLLSLAAAAFIVVAMVASHLHGYTAMFYASCVWLLQTLIAFESELRALRVQQVCRRIGETVDAAAEARMASSSRMMRNTAAMSAAVAVASAAALVLL